METRLKYLVARRPCRCQHCGYEGFIKRSAQLNTSILSFFNLDFLNRSATVLTCGGCGLVHWFDPKVAEVEPVA